MKDHYLLDSAGLIHIESRFSRVAVCELPDRGDGKANPARALDAKCDLVHGVLLTCLMCIGAAVQT